MSDDFVFSSPDIGNAEWADYNDTDYEEEYSIFTYAIAGLGGLIFAGALSDPTFANDYQYQAYDRLPNVIPSAPELMQLRRRDKITDTDFYRLMKLNGIDIATSDTLYELTKYVPTPPEIAEWARREAFQEEYIQEFGGDLEYPEQMDTLAKLIGADYDPFGDQPNMMRYFWRSHWQIPGVGQAFEMFHRGVIDDDELDKLFIAADIMPGWRDKLKSISYNLPTRVDVRRMFRVGVIDADEVYRFYQMIGYTDENAQRLTEFTVITEGEEFTNLTRTQIVKAYTEGVFTRTEALQYLQAIGYNDYDSVFYIDMADIDTESDREKQLTTIYSNNYVRGIDSLDTFISNLNSMDLPSTQQEILLSTATVKRHKTKINASKGIVESWYKLGYIDEDDTRHRLSNLNYTDGDIDLFIREMSETPEGNVTLPSKADILGWYSGDYIDTDEARKYLRFHGYQEWAIDLYIKQSDDKRMKG